MLERSQQSSSQPIAPAGRIASNKMFKAYFCKAYFCKAYLRTSLLLYVIQNSDQITHLLSDNTQGVLREAYLSCENTGHSKFTGKDKVGSGCGGGLCKAYLLWHQLVRRPPSDPEHLLALQAPTVPLDQPSPWDPSALASPAHTACSACLSVTAIPCGSNNQGTTVHESPGCCFHLWHRQLHGHPCANTIVRFETCHRGNQSSDWRQKTPILREPKLRL